MGKISALRKAAVYTSKVFKTRTVSAESNRLFSFAKKHNFLNSKGTLNEDGLILTHLTDFAPSKGVIDTARTAINGSRNSVHFAVNHGVASHELGDWSKKNYAILMPMKGTRRIKSNTFAGGVATDFYSKGAVRIPKGSVIVRKNSKIPAGKYRISDASKVEEFKDLRGVKVIETSNPNMKESVDNIIKKMGYDLKNTDNPWYWGNNQADKQRFEHFSLFNKFLTKRGMKPMFHLYTPNGKIEMMIEHINMRGLKNNSWTVANSGKQIADYKKEYIKVLNYIEKYAAGQGYPLDFDTKIIKKIIKNSSTPKEAIELLNKKGYSRFNGLDLSQLPENRFEPAFMCYSRNVLGGSKDAEFADTLVNKYLNLPNEENLNMFINTSNEALKKDINKIISLFQLNLP